MEAAPGEGFNSACISYNKALMLGSYTQSHTNTRQCHKGYVFFYNMLYVVGQLFMCVLEGGAALGASCVVCKVFYHCGRRSVQNVKMFFHHVTVG